MIEEFLREAVAGVNEEGTTFDISSRWPNVLVTRLTEPKLVRLYFQETAIKALNENSFPIGVRNFPALYHRRIAAYCPEMLQSDGVYRQEVDDELFDE